MGAPVRAAGEAGPGGGDVNRGSGPGRSLAVPALWTPCPEAERNLKIARQDMKIALVNSRCSPSSMIEPL